jgi:hypothetical protein
MTVVSVNVGQAWVSDRGDERIDAAGRAVRVEQFGAYWVVAACAKSSGPIDAHACTRCKLIRRSVKYQADSEYSATPDCRG